LQGYPAANAGIRDGAKIISIDGENVRTFGQMREILMYNKDKEMRFVVDNKLSYDTLNVYVDNAGRIGVYTSHPVYELKKYDFFSAIKYGWEDAFEAMHSNIKGFGLIFSGKESVRENLSGPIGIAQAYGGVWNWERFWKLTAIISMVLAFVNILPIPALDGGHALFLLIEAITRRKLSDKFMEIVQIVGMLIIFGLMIFIIGNDIIKLF
jgi:regulator of sigma E protease